MEASFQLHGYSGTVKWEVDGTTLSGSTNHFNVPGYYNVSAYGETGVIPGQSKFLSSREVFIPSVMESDINVSSNISYDRTPEITLTLNSLYSFSLEGKTSIPELPGSNSISAMSPGFITMNKIVEGGQAYNFTISALPVDMDLFANPGFANVTADNISFTEVGGIFKLSIYPEELYLNVSAAGYGPVSHKVSLMPDITYSDSIYLTPLHAVQKITGRVTDRIFKYGLSGVTVSSNSSNYVFTNSTGYYVFYNTNETKNLTFSRQEYNSTVIKVDSTANETINVQLIPLKVTASALFSIGLGRYFPFLFSLAYLSWNTNAASSSLFSSYQIIYSDNSVMNNPSYLNISNPGTQSTVLAGIFPGKTYYVTINMYLSNGQIVTGNTITISYSNLIDLVMNLVILAGVGIYAYVAIGFIIRRRNRKKSS